MSSLQWVFMVLVAFAIFYGCILLSLKRKWRLAVISVVLWGTEVVRMNPKPEGVEMFAVYFLPAFFVVMGSLIGIALVQKRKWEGRNPTSA